MTLVNQLLVFIQFSSLFWTIFSSENTEPFAIQRAQCTITAGEIQASAEATMTKSLKGVCGSDEMQLAFQDLEIKLMKDIKEIKTILYDLQTTLQINQPKVNDEKNTVFNKELHDPTTKIKSQLSHPQLQNIEKKNNHFVESSTITVAPERKISPLKLKSLNDDNSPVLNKINRDAEISKLNNTVLSEEEVKLFLYYWKLENFTRKLNNTYESTEWSPIFSIAGKHLRIKAIFNHLKRDFLYLQLDQATSDNYNKFKNVILETGTIFKNIEEDMKQFKHKISILNQISPSSDLVSQEFTNIIGNGFLVPNSVLLSNPYLKNDTIVIKSSIYL